MNLSSLGWDDSSANAFQPFAAAGFLPARVALEHKHTYELLTAHGEVTAVCTGRLLHSANNRSELPAVGDWVAVHLRAGEVRADIHAVLPRRTKFSRRAAGDVAIEQVIAANVDTVLLVTALDANYNLRRIERYLAVAWESGAQPVVVLNKADRHPDPLAAQAEVTAIAGGTPVVTLCALVSGSASLSLDASAVHLPSDFAPDRALAPWLIPGRTLALLGSSGVGKSTLINQLSGTERQRIAETSGMAGKGRHTTTHRELIVAPSGVLVIDTPGMRELQFWEVGVDPLDTTFADIAVLAAACRFRDCTHRTEPGCAMQAALAAGALDAGRWQSFQKLQREQAYAARKTDPRLARATITDWKKRYRAQRANYRAKHAD